MKTNASGQSSVAGIFVPWLAVPDSKNGGELFCPDPDSEVTDRPDSEIMDREAPRIPIAEMRNPLKGETVLEDLVRL